ncbi:mannosyltransferase [Streptomyces sp. BK022]|uniref:glycosyltransferase family 39 protein n=1 Tax=Streptomyces sp. BK022 TaxID=2512123 RepID=UPI0010E43952|nr:glycosyltransferase family 39 protein [Streptomyces sp. BK022]RZU37707.1 mannosyltransferase [Streptomyces sp. BK022]
MNTPTRDLDRPLAPPRVPERRTTAPVLAPAVLAAVLGLWGLTRHSSMWRDESVTYQVSHRTLGELLALLGRIDAVHGLYYLLMHGVFALWDGGLVALRLPSVPATALAAAGVGALGSRLAGPRAGVLSGVLFALFPATQQYAQEGRSYALVTAGVVWATYLFVRGIDSAARGWWAGYGALLAVVCWVHEFAALVLLAHAVTLRLLGVPWRRWGWAAAGVLVAVAPLAVVGARQAGRQLGWLGRPSPAMWLAFLAVSALGLLLSRVPPLADRTVTALALPLLTVPPGLLITVSLLRPWYVDRYVLYALTGLALLAGLALDRLPAHVGKAAVCLLALALLPASLAVRTPESREDDVVAVARTVRKLSRPGDGVLFLPSRRREWLLSYPALYARLDDVALARSPAASRTLQGTELPPDTIRSRLLAVPRVIALTDPDGRPLDPFPREEVKRRTLREYFEECGRVRVWGAQVVVYVRRPDAGSAARAEGCRGER